MASTTIIHNPLPVTTPQSGVSLHRFSPFSSPQPSSRPDLIKSLTTSSHTLNRSVGCLVGLGVGDSLGAPLEFLPVTLSSLPESPKFDLETFEYRNTPHSRFEIQPGQWTDDTSMAMCLADGLIENEGAYKGSDTRTRYWHWWHSGLNNAFRNSSDIRHSVGLGGNIKKSLDSLTLDSNPTDNYNPTDSSQDAGNGSLMRLGPIPICFHRSQWSTINMAKQSSYATHPGPIAADACGFLSFVIAKAIKRTGSMTAREFIEDCREEFLECHAVNVCEEVVRLVRAEESEGGNESVWNWRDDSLKIQETCKARGYAYNGYANTPEYFGSFSLDGLAIALNSFYTTVGFNECVVKCANCLGDADTTSAIAGQIAGAFYGYDSIDERFIEQLRRWDDDEIALRAILLHRLHEKK